MHVRVSVVVFLSAVSSIKPSGYGRRAMLHQTEGLVRFRLYAAASHHTLSRKCGFGWRWTNVRISEYCVGPPGRFIQFAGCGVGLLRLNLGNPIWTLVIAAFQLAWVVPRRGSVLASNTGGQNTAPNSNPGGDAQRPRPSARAKTFCAAKACRESRKAAEVRRRCDDSALDADRLVTLSCAYGTVSRYNRDRYHCEPR